MGRGLSGRWVAALLIAMVVVVAGAARAQTPGSDRRVALVIGNGNYQGAAKARQPGQRRARDGGQAQRSSAST